MKTRTLTEEEKTELLKLHSDNSAISVKEALFFLGVSLVLSIPFSIVFFVVAHLGKNEPLARSLAIGGYGLLIGPGVLFVIAIQVVLRPSPFSATRKEILNGICSVKSYRLIRCFHLIDDGNENEPDVLAELGDNKVISIPHYEIANNGPLKKLMEVSYLPISKIDIGITFTGETASICGEIRTDNVWRNDDLPYLKPIPMKKLPNEALAVIGPVRASH